MKLVNNILTTLLDPQQEQLIDINSKGTQACVAALDYAILSGSNTVSTEYLGRLVNPVTLFNLTKVLSDIELVRSNVRKNYANLEVNLDIVHSFISPKQLVAARLYKKFSNAIMREDTETYASTLVKTPHGVDETGLSRPGFARVAKCTFKLDQAMLSDYFEPIYLNVVKSITKAVENGKLKDRYFQDKANYEILVKEVLEYYLVNNGCYNMEYNISDQRGRSIYNAIKRIANPISSKDIRACLVASEATLLTTVSRTKLDDIFYFVAELVGSKAKSEKTKIAQGKRYYRMRKLPELDLALEDDRKDLHELIWLERIYEKLDTLYLDKVVNWDIPLEIDCSMSLNQIVGALTGDKRLLERTNVIGETLTDPWAIEGVRRLSGKLVGTPVFYGSSQSAISLLKKKNQSIIPKEVKAINNEFRQGGFAVTKALKNALISNYNNYQPAIQIKLWNDTFTVHVNKFKRVGATVTSTVAYDTVSKRTRVARTRHPILVPDYKYMKLFWATCGVHGLESQIMDYIADTSDCWMLTIHDAIIALPGNCSKLRSKYAIRLKKLHTERKQILTDYRKSIGATTRKADIDFMKLHKMIQHADEDVQFNASAMK